MESMQQFVFKGRRQRWDDVVTKTDSISDDVGVGSFSKDMITMVVMEGRPQMETFCGAKVPGLTDQHFVMYEDLNAGTAYGCGIKVECAKERMPGQG